MMNVNNGRVEPETELGLALASSSRCMPHTRSSSSGAGVNAASVVDMTCVPSDHLSELVWSPHYGLSLRCAEKKPSIFGDAGPSNFVLTPTGSFATPGAAANLNRENQLQASLVRSRATVGAIRPLTGSSHGYEEGASNDVDETKDIRGAPVVDSDRKEEDTPMTDGKKQCSSKSVQFTCIAEAAENYTASRSPKTVEFFPIKANDPGPSKPQTDLLSAKVAERDEEIMDSTCAVAGHERALGLEVGFDTGLHKMKQFKDNSDSSASNSTFPDVKDKDLRLAVEEEQESKPDMFDSTYLRKRKGKEKALPDVEPEDKLSKGENSHESVESCNSGGVFSSGRKRPNFEQQLIVSKRLKTQTTAATPVSASFIGQDSSFMNWISNMVKGLNKMGEDEPPLTLPGPVHRSHDQPISRNDDPGSRNMGFQTIFQSIYNCKASNQDSPVGESKMSAANISPIACYGKNAVGTCSPPSSDHNKTVRTLACIGTKDGITPSNSLQPELDSVRNNGSETPLEVKAPNDAELRSNHRGSLWIARLKSDASTDCTRTLTKIDRSSEVSEFLSNPALHVEKLNNPEAMTSVFAKRVDALKHIVSSSDTMEAAAHTTTCFYCGRTGHNMGDCSEIAEAEREGLMKNISQSDGVEDSSPSLCIRCFQPDHWANSCPTRSKFGPQRSKQGATLGNRLNASSRSQLVASSSGDSVFKEKQVGASVCDVARSNFSDVPRGLFDAVKKLQLSRTDILKWMNSCTSLLHLNGYFLRLRLAKWEGGTGYHVACIAVDQREKPAQGSRKPISVDVGGTRCLVESQYISNQVFLEDELKAWWKATIASGGKIPSPDHLISKLEEKQKLGI